LLESVSKRALGCRTTKSVAGKDEVVVAGEVDSGSEPEQGLAQSWRHRHGRRIHSLGPIVRVSHPVVVDPDHAGVEVDGAPAKA
jgi:hypothetical protein